MPPSGGGGDGGVRLSAGPAFLEHDAAALSSDASSVISISDTLRASDTDGESEWNQDGRGEDLVDKQKYRMPDPPKTRLDLRTKEPLSPRPLHVQHPSSQESQQSTQQPQHSSPQTPRNGRSTYFDGASPSPWTNGGGQQTPSERPSLSRSNSIYTLGRASLQDQLSQLTNMKLPDANSLAKRISEIPSYTEAAKALSDASEQIRLWINKVSDVLNGLNAEDDVEWAAAGGREGIEDVDRSISLFEGLVEVYLRSIDELQQRADITQLSAEELKGTVKQVESITASWHDVKKMLGGVKEQVEVAMEWEELWNTFLGDIAQEVESLNRLVFEMEERRHQGAGILTSKDEIDLGDLQTIVEERPGTRTQTEILEAGFMSPPQPLRLPSQENVKDDSSLLALFARMQPLRASLDFLPMKLSAFQLRGSSVFPSACQDLDLRRSQLESQWQKLEADAEFLRRELGEDRWILVFRNAGRQALKMCESITRSYNKLKDAVSENEDINRASSYAGKVENYNAKKTYYGPAIVRVLAIIDRGVQDRLTVNGDILRLQSDMRERWTTLQTAMAEMDAVLEEISVDTADKQLRDSISTVLSSERSGTSSMIGNAETPGSSPASSVMGSSRRGSYHGSTTPTPLTNPKTRPFSLPQPGSARSSLASSIPRRIQVTESASPLATRTASPSPLIGRSTLRSSMGGRLEPPTPSRPRWSHSTRLENHDFPPLSAMEPSPYAKAPIEKRTTFLRATRTASQPALTPFASRVRNTTDRIPTTPASVPSLRTSKPTPPHPSSSATTTSTPPSASSTHRSFLPVPSSAPAQMVPSTTQQRYHAHQADQQQLQSFNRPARTPLRQPRSHASLRAASTSTTGTSTRRSSLAPALQRANGGGDGNEADTETTGPEKRRLSRSRFAVSVREEFDDGGRRVGGVGSRVGSRMSMQRSRQQGQQRPHWRP